MVMKYFSRTQRQMGTTSIKHVERISVDIKKSIKQKQAV